MAILMSPSFKGETAEPLPATGRTRFALCYGSEDRTIPLADQQCAHNKLAQTGNLTYFEYPGMAHGICNQEIRDLRASENISQRKEHPGCRQTGRQRGCSPLAHHTNSARSHISTFTNLYLTILTIPT